MAQNLEIATSSVFIALDKLMKEQTFALIASAPSFQYQDGKKTDVIDGTRYTVANVQTFDKFDVKTPEKTPVVSSEQIASMDERVFVSFSNAVAKPVKIEYGHIFFNVTADCAKIVRKTN